MIFYLPLSRILVIRGISQMAPRDFLFRQSMLVNECRYESKMSDVNYSPDDPFWGIENPVKSKLEKKGLI